MGSPTGKSRRNPLLGAAVLRALLRRRAGETQGATIALYEGVLRDLNLTDSQVDAYLADHAAEVEVAIRRHGRRGD